MLAGLVVGLAGLLLVTVCIIVCVCLYVNRGGGHDYAHVDPDNRESEEADLLHKFNTTTEATKDMIARITEKREELASALTETRKLRTTAEVAVKGNQADIVHQKWRLREGMISKAPLKDPKKIRDNIAIQEVAIAELQKKERKIATRIAAADAKIESLEYDLVLFRKYGKVGSTAHTSVVRLLRGQEEGRKKSENPPHII